MVESNGPPRRIGEVSTMNHSIRRRNMLRTGVAICASLLATPTRACEYFSGTLRITHPWTRATLADSSDAVLCMTFDEVQETERLIGVETPVAARAELVTANTASEVNLLIPEGQQTVLSEEGTHIRLLGLTQPLQIGRTYPLRLTFEKAGPVNALLNVDYFRLKLPIPGLGRHS
jgi:copper(I)-binding protein